MAKRLETVEIEGKKFAPLDGDGNPFLIDDEGQKGAFDYQAALRDNARLRGFSKDRETWETEREALRVKATALDKLGKTPEELAEALKVVSGLKAKDLIEAKEVDAEVQRRVAEGLKQRDEALQQSEQRENSIKGRVRQLLLNNALLESEKSGVLSKTRLIADTALPLVADFLDVVESEDGSFEIVPYRDKTRKEKLWNADGKVAGIDEALTTILRSHPRSAEFFDGVNAAGGGAPGGARTTAAPASKPKAAMTHKEKADYITANGADAYKALQ